MWKFLISKLWPFHKNKQTKVCKNCVYFKPEMALINPEIDTCPMFKQKPIKS